MPAAVALAVQAAPPPATAFFEVGVDTGRGNLLGLQPWLTAADYSSEQALGSRIDAWFAEAAAKGWLRERTVVVLPEYTGTWLVAANEGEKVLGAPTVHDAMAALAHHHFLAFVGRFITSGARDRSADAIFHIQADEMAAAWNDVFSELAARWKVTVVGGSIVLPGAHVEDGRVMAGHGPLQNVSAVWGPDGRALPDVVRKVAPIDDEKPFLRGAPADQLPVFDTPIGRLGVLICADSWYPEVYDAVAAGGAQVLAVPSFLSANGAWDEPWHGYNGAPAPSDVVASDVGTLTEGQAWMRYAVPARGPDSGAEAAVNVFLRGQLWDLGDDGRTLAVVGRKATVGPAVDGPVLVNVWLGEQPPSAEETDALDAAGDQYGWSKTR
jgi:predicted amidohydrolase